MQVAADYMPNVESVAIRINVQTGSRNEDAITSGISHFIEHMAFKGTEKRNAVQIANDFENIGANFNAYTSQELTVYYGQVLKEKAEDLFEILADIVQNQTFDPEEMEKERGVILQEISMRNDEPDTMAFEYFGDTAFPKQSHGRPVIGTAENVKRFTRNDLLKYVQKNYIAKNITITASGNITNKQLLEYVSKYMTKVSTKTQHKYEKAQYKGGYFVKEKDIEQTHIILGFEGKSYEDKDLYKLNILHSILGQGMSSRLFQEVREKQGLCYTIYSFNDPTYETGTFAIYTATDPTKVKLAIDSIFASMKNMIENGITEAELARAKINAKSSILMRMENTSYRASILASYLIFKKKLPNVTEISEELDKTTAQDVINLLKTTLKTKPTTVIYGKTTEIYTKEEINKKVKELQKAL